LGSRIAEMRSMRIMRPALLLLIAAVVSAQTQTKANLPANLTLRQALELALTNSSTLREAQANLERISGKYGQVRSDLLPQLSVVARQGYLTVNLPGFGIEITGQPGLIGPFGSMDARVVLTQDLLNIASMRSWQSFSSREESARFQVNNAREVVTLNVVSAYLQALTAKSNRDTVTEQAKLATELYMLTADRLKQGVASELDANRAKQKVNSLEQKRQEAEQSYVAAKLSLANFIQANITADFEVSDPAAYGSGATMDKGASLQAALTTRPDYRAAESNVRAAELHVKSVEATYLPTLSVRATDGQSGTYPVHNVNVYSVFGTLEFPIFTSGRISGEVQEAKSVLQEAAAALDKQRAQIEAEVLTAISGVEWALKEVETSSQNVGLSRQEVDLSRSRFLQGVTDNTEVINAQDRLSQADDSQIRAQYTLGLARANLARAMGGAERAYRK
jgi:outer membrane protein TolC